jgi:hypothetical protein
MYMTISGGTYIRCTRLSVAALVSDVHGNQWRHLYPMYTTISGCTCIRCTRQSVAELVSDVHGNQWRQLYPMYTAISGGTCIRCTRQSVAALESDVHGNQWRHFYPGLNLITTRTSSQHKSRTVGPRFTNAPVHEQFGSRTNFPRKNVSDDERCLGLRTRKLRVSAWESVAG